MRNFFKMTEKQIHQNVLSLRFGLAVILCTIVCMLSTISYWDEQAYRSNSVLKFFIMGGFEKFAGDSIDFSSWAIINNFLYSPWFSMLILAICAFPAVSLFADEYYSGAIYFTLPGSSVNRYSAVKFVSAALSGGLVFLCGFGFYALLILLRFPSVEEYPADMIQSYQMMYGNTDVWSFMRMIVHMTVVAMLCASAVMMLSTFLKDRYFLFGLPMLIVFFIERLSMYVGSIYMEIYDEGKGWWMLFVPSSYPSFFRDFEYNVGLPYGFFLLFALVEITVMFMIFRKRIDRRVRCNA